MFSSDQKSWSNPKVLAVLILVFACGGLSGALAYRFARPARLVAAPPTWNNKEVLLGKFQRELNLTPEQTKKVALVLDDYKMFYQNLQEQLDEVRATGKGKIVEILTDEQKKKFEKLVTEVPK